MTPDERAALRTILTTAREPIVRSRTILALLDALDAAERDAVGLRAALAFYADESNYGMDGEPGTVIDSPCGHELCGATWHCDRGEIARTALAPPAAARHAAHGTPGPTGAEPESGVTE